MPHARESCIIYSAITRIVLDIIGVNVYILSISVTFLSSPLGLLTCIRTLALSYELFKLGLVLSLVRIFLKSLIYY